MTKPLMNLNFVLCLLINTTVATANEPIIGGPCQGCEFVFADMPERLNAHARIAPVNEPGEKMVLSGKVYRQDGSLAAGITVYAYQTNSEGLYPKGANFHGTLRSWALTGSNGEYRFTTIRPKAYPGRSIPEHIHLHVLEPNKGTYYIDSVEFSDDSLLTNEIREKRQCRGGCGVTTPTLGANGVWHVSRDIYLGKAIPNY